MAVVAVPKPVNRRSLWKTSGDVEFARLAYIIPAHI